MIDYRLYIMDAEGVHIEDVRTVQAIGDNEAIGEAALFEIRFPSELWQCGRHIQTFRYDRASGRSMVAHCAVATIH